MTKTRNNKFKKNKSIKSNGGSDLEQKYSLASIDEGNELGRFNTIIGFLGIGGLLYYVFYKQNAIDNFL